MTTLALIALIALLIFGAPIFAVIIGFTLLGATQGRGMEDFSGYLASTVGLGTSEHAQILSTIPLFILAGYLMAESKTASRMVRFAQAMLGWLPGGLAVVTIWACALFTTFTGASGVTIVALGGLIMPSLLKEGYPQRFSLGLVAGTGSVGLLFPPALPLFVYGTVFGVAAQLSGAEIDFDTRRFLFAGIVPGLVLVGIMSLFAITVGIIKKVPRRKFDLAELARSFVPAAPEIAIPFLVIIGLITGIGIPEIASLTVVYVLLIELFLYKDIQVGGLLRLTRESMVLVGAIFIIILVAAALTNYIVTAGIPALMVEWIGERIDSKWAFLLVLNVLLIVVGMVMDIFSAIVIVVPLIAPIAIEYGIDPFHLGVIFLLNLEIGYITPPVGLNLFITSFKFQRPIVEVTRATLPFLLCMIIALVLVTYIPALTVVPEAERRGRADQLVEMVQRARATVGMVQEVTLPDGTVKRLAECKEIPPGLDRGRCEAVFADVSQCREKHAEDRAAAERCERDVLEAYVAAKEDLFDDDDWGDWDSDPADEADEVDDEVDDDPAEPPTDEDGGDGDAFLDDDDDEL